MKAKMTRRALLMSALSLLLCVSMLLGTTFAWFTDSVSSAGNTIQSGNLKVDIVDESGTTSLVGNGLLFRNVDGATDILWEPGVTFRTEAFKIKNAGNLALKYRINLNGVDGDAKLLEVISFNIIKADGTAVELETFEGTLKAADELSEIYYIEGKMAETANNDYQNLTLEGISVTVVAGQAMHESDSFDDTYDANAEYPESGSNKPQTPTFTVGTASQLQAAMQPDNSTGDLIINITDNMELAAGETWTPLSLNSYTGVARIVINGNGHTIKGLNDCLIEGVIFGNTKVEINDLTLDSSNVNRSGNYAGAYVANADNAKSITLNNCHLTNSTIKSAKYSGGLIGYVSGNVTLNGCSVKICTIEGESVGSLVGMISVGQGGETAIISAATATGNTITSNKVDTYRVGELVGGSNIARVELSNITTSGNNCSQPGSTGATSGMISTKWIGRASNVVIGDTSEVINFS